MLCDPHMGGGIKYCGWTGHFGEVVSVCFDIWVLRSKIAIRTYIQGMWSVLFVPYVGGGI